MWKNTVKPTIALPAARPSAQDSTAPHPSVIKFIPRPIKQQRSKLLEGCVFNFQWSVLDTKDSFFAYIKTINKDLGGIEVKNQTDPRITHYIVVLPKYHQVPKIQYSTREVAGDRKWQYVVREHAKWYDEQGLGLDVDRNLKEGRRRIVVRREWFKEVVAGCLDPWSATTSASGAVVGVGKVMEQGQWEVCLKSDGKSHKDGEDAGEQNNKPSGTVKTAVDPRLRPIPLALSTQREDSPEHSYLFTPPSSGFNTPPPSASDEMDVDLYGEGQGPPTLEVDGSKADMSSNINPSQLDSSASYSTPPPSASTQPYTYPYDPSALFTPPPPKSPDLSYAHVSPVYEPVPLFSIDAPFGYKKVLQPRPEPDVEPVIVLDYGSPIVSSVVESGVEEGLGIVFGDPPQSTSPKNESPQLEQARRTQEEESAGPSTPPRQPAHHALIQRQPGTPSYKITRRITAGGIKRPRSDDNDNVIPPLIKRKSLPVPVSRSRCKSASRSPLSSVLSPDHIGSQDEDDSEDEDDSMALSSESEIDMDIDIDSYTDNSMILKSGNEDMDTLLDAGKGMGLQEALLACDLVSTMAEMLSVGI